MIDDLTATREVESEGYRVLRLREQPLPLLGVDELAFPSNLSFKELVNMTLLWIKVSFTFKFLALPRKPCSLSLMRRSAKFRSLGELPVCTHQACLLQGKKEDEPISRYEFVRMLLSEDSGFNYTPMGSCVAKGGK